MLVVPERSKARATRPTREEITENKRGSPRNRMFPVSARRALSADDQDLIPESWPGPPAAPHSVHNFSQFQIPDVTAIGNGNSS